MPKTNVNTLENDKTKNIIKTLLVFLCYFLYTSVVSSVLSAIGVNDSTIISFVADIIFFVGIVYAYKDNLKRDFLDLRSNYKISKIMKTVLLWVGIIFVFNIFMGVLSSIIPNETLDGNTNAINSMLEFSTIYTLFKTMLFAVFAEELLFRQTLGSLIKDDVVFIIITALIYTVMNFIFIGFDFFSISTFIHILSYFLPALIFSYAYIKNNRNIFILMLIKFVYQLIPLTILLLGL